MNKYLVWVLYLLILQGCKTSGYPCNLYKKWDWVITQKDTNLFNNMTNCRVPYDKLFSYRRIKSLGNLSICKKAIHNDKWSTKISDLEFIKEAKRRKLLCGLQ